MTPNACTECRKKRAKCDGQTPCGRCKSQKDVECVYEAPVRQSKDNLRSEIDQLRRQQKSSEAVLAALARNDQWEEVLRRLRNGQGVDTISEWLNSQASSAASTMPTFGRPANIGANMTPMAIFAGASAHSFTPHPPGMSGGAGVAPRPGENAAPGRTLSPMSTAQFQAPRPEMDPNSPWGTQSHFSSTSQARSTRSDSHHDMNWGSGPPQTRVGRWVEDSLSQMHGAEPGQRYRGLDQVLAPELPRMNAPATTWTEISSDKAFVQHLLALYFCWEYPTFASLSKEHFLKDFQAGRPRYCSRMLVNALLALGCRFSSQPSTLANPKDPYSSGDHFFKECLRLFYQETNHHNMTTIQALGIMSIREASCGRDSESWYYAGQSIRLAIEMGLHRVSDKSGDSDEIAVQAATFWGAFSLDHAWSLATGSLPQSSCFPRLPPKPAIMPDIEASFWVPYTDDGAPLQRSCEQPSNVRSVYKCFCELSELVHESLYILHSPGRLLTSRDLINIYTDFLNWYDNIPEVLRLGHNFTPAVLFAHMYYHFAILLLFRPLIKLRIIGSTVSPREVCTQAADAIQGLLHSYSQLYTLRRTPSFVPYFVLTSSIMHLAIAASSSPLPSGLDGYAGQKLAPAKLGDKVTKSINQGIEDLTEMAPCHHFAEQALNILRYLAKKWNIEVDVDVADRLRREKEDEGQTDQNGNAVLLEDRERVQLGSRMKDHDWGTRAATSSRNFFSPNIREQDFISSFGSAMPPPNGSTSPPVARSGEAMENPLFWPFPMQGRPMLPEGDLLKDAGFELLS